jgi:hypothetical protein
VHQADRASAYDEFHLPGRQSEHFLPAHYTGERFGKRGRFETRRLILDRVNVAIREDRKILVCAVGEAGVQTTVGSSSPTVGTDPAFDNKVGHDALADLQVSDVFAYFDNASTGFMSHDARKRHTFLASVNADIPWAYATVGDLD